MYCLDTNVIIAALSSRHGQALRARICAERPSLFCLPAIVKAELLTGVEKSERVRQNRSRLTAFVKPMRIVDFSDAMAATYAAIRVDLERKGTPIGPNDLIVAATAKHIGATLITGNVREFKRVKGLRVENWLKLSA